MIEHSPAAWDHKLFKEILVSVPNTEVYYKAIDFYLQEHPLLLNELLMEQSITSKLDHSKVVGFFRSKAHLPLIEKYLLLVQKDNLPAVNEALNELFLAEEKWKLLRESVDNYKNFDQIALAQKIESHDLLEFRRISAYLFKLNKRFDKSLDLSKADALWQDAMETAAESKTQELAEGLLYFFVSKGERECFAACLYTCYELIRADVVLELSWRHGLTDFAMPFIIQNFRQYNDRLNSLSTKCETLEKQLSDKDKKEPGTSDAATLPIFTHTPQLALMPPPGYGGAGLQNLGPMQPAMAPIPMAPMGGFADTRFNDNRSAGGFQPVIQPNNSFFN